MLEIFGNFPKLYTWLYDKSCYEFIVVNFLFFINYGLWKEFIDDVGMEIFIFYC